MSDAELTSERRLLGATLGVFVLVAALAAADVVSDLGEGAGLGHVALELGIVVAALAGAAGAARKLVASMRAARAAHARASELAGQLEVTRAEAARWRAEARTWMLGLGAAIDGQFERWGLSPAEKEVGLLLLKGLSHKEIAAARSVTEATARQQARALYRKAGLTGRADLSAFFLEDLMLPAEARARGPEPEDGGGVG